MAKVQIEDDYVDIQLSLLEKLRWSKRSRRVPLLHIVGVDPHSADESQSDWSDAMRATHRWSEGILYDEDLPLPHGETRAAHQSRTLTIDLCHEDVPYLDVELEDESPEVVADRIRLAVAAAQASAIQQMRSRYADRGLPPLPPSEPPPPLSESDLESDSGAHGIPYRITPLPAFYSEPAPPMRLDDDRSLARLGGWLLGSGMFGLLTGTAILAGGAVPGLLVIGAGAACSFMGGIALAVVLYHQ